MLKKDPWVVDIGNSKNFGPSVAYDQLPCITKARSDRGGFWIVKDDNFTTDDELIRGQGFVPDKIIVPDRIDRRKMLQMIGNAFTVNVLSALFRNILPALDL